MIVLMSLAAAAIMAVIPAHIMRSVGGGYDNESIALTAMCATFYCWVRSLRPDPKATDGTATRDSLLFGLLTGISYIYMVAAWGGYVFVLNMVRARPHLYIYIYIYIYTHIYIYIYIYIHIYMYI